MSAAARRARQAGSRDAADLARRLAAAALGLSVEGGKVLVPDAQVEYVDAVCRGGGAGRDPDRPAAGRGPGDRSDHRRAAGRRLVRGSVQPARGADDGDHDPPLRRPAFTTDELTASGSLSAPLVEAAAAVLRSERNVLISGGTGSGKTTLLNALVSLLPAGGRVISIEDTLELRLRRTNGPRFEARGLVGRDVTIRDLVRHALRHRPDHIVVGEVRGAAAADLLQALNTGHGGSLATVHANNATAALSRLATCAMQASGELPWRSSAASSTASRPSFTRRGRRKGPAASTRWSASGTTTRARTAAVDEAFSQAPEEEWTTGPLVADVIEAGVERAGRRSEILRRRSSGPGIAGIGRRGGLEVADVGADLRLGALVLGPPLGTPVFRQLGPGSMRHLLDLSRERISPSRRNSFT